MNTKRQNITGSLMIAAGLFLVLCLRIYGIYNSPVKTLSSRSENFLLGLLAAGIVINLVIALITLLGGGSGSAEDYGTRKRKSLTLWMVAVAVACAYFAIMVMDRTNQGEIVGSESVPFSASELSMYTDADESVITRMEQTAPLAGYLYVFEKVAEGEDTLLTYQVVTSPQDFLLDLCFDRMLKSGNVKTPTSVRHYVEEEDASRWNSDTVYRLDSTATDIYQYLIRYPDRVVEIYFNEQPTDEDIETAVNALTKGS